MPCLCALQEREWARPPSDSQMCPGPGPGLPLFFTPRRRGHPRPGRAGVPETPRGGGASARVAVHWKCARAYRMTHRADFGMKGTAAGWNSGWPDSSPFRCRLSNMSDSPCLDRTLQMRWVASECSATMARLWRSNCSRGTRLVAGPSGSSSFGSRPPAAARSRLPAGSGPSPSSSVADASPSSSAVSSPCGHPPPAGVGVHPRRRGVGRPSPRRRPPA